MKTKLNSRINLDELILEAQYNDELYEMYQEFIAEGGTPGISSDVRKAENMVQAYAFRDLSGGDDLIVRKLIDLLGGIFRKAIKEYRKRGKIPSEEELLDYTSAYLGDDVWEVAKELKKNIL